MLFACCSIHEGFFQPFVWLAVFELRQNTDGSYFVRALYQDQPLLLPFCDNQSVSIDSFWFEICLIVDGGPSLKRCLDGLIIFSGLPVRHVQVQVVAAGREGLVRVSVALQRHFPFNLTNTITVSIIFFHSDQCGGGGHPVSASRAVGDTAGRRLPAAAQTQPSGGKPGGGRPRTGLPSTTRQLIVFFSCVFEAQFHVSVFAVVFWSKFFNQSFECCFAETNLFMCCTLN